MTNPVLMRRIALALTLIISAPRQARGQEGVTLWAGLGYSSTEGNVTLGKSVKQAGAQFAIPLVPVAIRADMILFGGTFKSDALSWNVNTVLRTQLPLVQPYLIIGRGRYATSLSSKVTGWNYGAGVHVGPGRSGVFAEYRRHSPVGRSITVLGLTF